MQIVTMDNQGRGITYYNDKIVFVNNALPNEDVDIFITLDKRNIVLRMLLSIIRLVTLELNLSVNTMVYVVDVNLNTYHTLMKLIIKLII